MTRWLVACVLVSLTPLSCGGEFTTAFSGDDPRDSATADGGSDVADAPLETAADGAKEEAGGDASEVAQVDSGADSGVDSVTDSGAGTGADTIDSGGSDVTPDVKIDAGPATVKCRVGGATGTLYECGAGVFPKSGASVSWTSGADGTQSCSPVNYTAPVKPCFVGEGCSIFIPASTYYSGICE